ncbi:MAG: exodeoxyribonuclease VII large subunit, partial [Pseudodesulfovibrio sp.]
QRNQQSDEKFVRNQYFYLGRVDETGRDAAGLLHRLGGAMARLGERRERALELATANLRGLDPEAPLLRGYSLVRIVRTGGFLRDPSDVTPGDALDIRVRDGRVSAIIADGGTATKERK